jgi:Protein of unknown function (DUF3987)
MAEDMSSDRSPEDILRDFGRPTEARTTSEQPRPNGKTDESPVLPVDLWDNFDPPDLPAGLLPPVIEQFARAQGKLMGADPAGIAMAALAVCAAAITDEITLQPFVNNQRWTESARLWVGLVGDSSEKKTPIIRAVIWPLDDIDGALFDKFVKDNAEYDAMSKEESEGQPKPVMTHLIVNNLTIESAEEAMAANPHGILIHCDEMAEWFGSMERYHGGGKAASDRLFWLQAYNGGRRRVGRIRRGHIIIENTSVCLIGGIQPEKIREIAAEASDEGLLQRIVPVLLKPSGLALEEPQGDDAGRYKRLIEQGNRVNFLRGDEGEKEFVVPGCGFSLEAH